MEKEQLTIPKNTHVKVLATELKKMPDGQVLKEKGDKVKVFTITDWKRMQSISAKNKYEFIEEIPMPDRDDILKPSKTGGKETGQWRRYMAAISENDEAKKEVERREQTQREYEIRKKAAMNEMKKIFKGKQDMAGFMSSVELVADMGAEMTDEKNLGAVYEKYAGNQDRILAMIKEYLNPSPK